MSFLPNNSSETSSFGVQDPPQDNCMAVVFDFHVRCPDAYGKFCEM